MLIDTPTGGHVRLEDVANVRISPTPTVIQRDAVSRRIDIGLGLGWSEDEAIAYARRWSLTTANRAEKSVGFCSHPLWSAYVPTYAYGYRLVRPFVDRAEGNFRRLLTEQLTTADLTA